MPAAPTRRSRMNLGAQLGADRAAESDRARDVIERRRSAVSRRQSCARKTRHVRLEREAGHRACAWSSAVLQCATRPSAGRPARRIERRDTRVLRRWPRRESVGASGAAGTREMGARLVGVARIRTRARPRPTWSTGTSSASAPFSRSALGGVRTRASAAVDVLAARSTAFAQVNPRAVAYGRRPSPNRLDEQRARRRVGAGLDLRACEIDRERRRHRPSGRARARRRSRDSARARRRGGVRSCDSRRAVSCEAEHLEVLVAELARHGERVLHVAQALSPGWSLFSIRMRRAVGLLLRRARWSCPSAS